MDITNSSLSSFSSLLESAKSNPAVVGVVLIGSRTLSELVTPHSDHDVVIVFDNDKSNNGNTGWRDIRYENVDILFLTLQEFRDYALRGHPKEWDRYSFVHAKVMYDSLGGEIAELVKRKAHLSEEEAKSIVYSNLDAYINFTYRSLKNARDGRILQSRLDAVEGIQYLLTLVFALEKRVRPYNKYLPWDLQHTPLSNIAFESETFLERLDRIMTNGDTATQRTLFGDVKSLAQSRGFGFVFDDWGNSLDIFQTTEKDINDERGKLWQATLKILAYVNRTHQTNFTLIKRFPEGRQSGAYLIHTPEGKEAVLKWNWNKGWAEKNQKAAPIIQAARAVGWPTPEWLVSGITPSGYPYQVLERAKGVHPKKVDLGFVTAVLPVIQSQAARYLECEQDYSEHDYGVIFKGRSGFLDTLAKSSPAGRAFVNSINVAMAPFHKISLPTADIVHGDFHTKNVFLNPEDGSISAIIDSEAIGKGSRFHDVATLITFGTLWDGEDAAIQKLIEYAREYALPGEFEICLVAEFVAILSTVLTYHPENVQFIEKASKLFRLLGLM